MSANSPSLSFPVVSRDPGIVTAFDRFQRSGEIQSADVRSVIDESWRRCYRSGIDPSRPGPKLPSGAAPLRPMSMRHRELLEASERVMSQAHDVLAGCGTIMILTDASGIILRAEGGDSALEAAQSLGLVEGSNCSEPSWGTNALGTALYLGEPVHVHGSEHYSLWLRRWTCSANVVSDPIDGTVLGAISIAGLSDTFDPHLLPLVLATTARVRSALLRQETLRREQLLEYALRMLSRKAANGLMLFDRRGRLVTADPRAGLALSEHGLTAESAACAYVSGLDVSHSSDGLPPPLPAWLSGNVVEPVLVGGDRIGSVVKIPNTTRLTVSSEGGLPRYKLRRIAEYIDSKIGGAISLDDLAQVAGVSRFHFHRQFRKSVGVTPHRYILQMRIERAKTLLLESDLAVGEVAGAVGFVDQSHFSNIFRKLTSMTPRTYRSSMST